MEGVPPPLCKWNSLQSVLPYVPLSVVHGNANPHGCSRHSSMYSITLNPTALQHILWQIGVKWCTPPTEGYQCTTPPCPPSAHGIAAIYCQCNHNCDSAPLCARKPLPAAQTLCITFLSLLCIVMFFVCSTTTLVYTACCSSVMLHAVAAVVSMPDADAVAVHMAVLQAPVCMETSSSV